MKCLLELCALLGIFCCVLGAISSPAKYYDSYSGQQITLEDYKRHIKKNTTFWCVNEVQDCDPNEPRRVDGSCYNLDHPNRGMSHTPMAQVLKPAFGKGFDPRTAKSGSPLPLSRRVRTTLLSEGRVPNPWFTQLLTHFLVFVSGDIISFHDTANYLIWTPHCCQPKGKTDRTCIPNLIPHDDPVHRFSNIRCMNLTRPFSFQSVGCTRKDASPERILTATPLFDLSHIYGAERKDMDKIRKYEGGLLKFEVEGGKVWPPSYPEKVSQQVCIANEVNEKRCHFVTDDGTNSILGTNLFVIWFWRHHNLVAKQLAKMNPCWDDDKLFYTARDINIAITMQIFYYEIAPQFLGKENLLRDGVISPDLGFRDPYNPRVIPQISVEFPVVLRWMHTMQEATIKMYDKNGYYVKNIPVTNLTLRTGYLALDKNLEYITQGSFRQPCAKTDYIVDPNMAEIGLGRLQAATDVFTSDLSKDRHFGFQPYIKYREFCFGQTFKGFDDLVYAMDTDRIELLKEVYEAVEDIDLIAGLWSERPSKHVPATFYCMVIEQMMRSMVSDRHWYERPNRPNAFTYDQLLEIRKSTVARLLCDAADGVKRIQANAFLRSGPTNEMVNCAKLQKINLEAWKDETCSKSYVNFKTY